MSETGDRAAYDRATAALRDPHEQRRVAVLVETLDQQLAPTVQIFEGRARLADVRAVGVLAGSFNPPTLAHVALATSAMKHGKLDAVLWTISRVTVDKERVTHASLPLRMITLAALLQDRLRDAAALVNRGLYAEQAVAMRRALPRLERLAFIVGFDKIEQIVDPRYYLNRDAALDQLFRQAEMLVAPRAGRTARDLTALFGKPENRAWAERVHPLPLAREWREISSSAVRQWLAEGRPITGIAPPETLALADAGAYSE
jgi:nicotinamide-nucleotide adenylyltransferase